MYSPSTAVRSVPALAGAAIPVMSPAAVKAAMITFIFVSVRFQDCSARAPTTAVSAILPEHKLQRAIAMFHEEQASSPSPHPEEAWGEGPRVSPAPRLAAPA